MNDDEKMEAIMVFMHRMGVGGKGGSKGGGKGNKGDREQRGDGTRKCVNCGSKDHLTQNCDKPTGPSRKAPVLEVRQDRPHEC